MARFKSPPSKSSTASLRVYPILLSFDATDSHFVAQYEVKFSKGVTCSGAYLKLLSTHAPAGADLAESSPYTIMFGPDKCGGTNKVHLIFRVKNPVSGEYEEKHMSKVVAASIDMDFHIYTLVVDLNADTFTVYVDGDEKVSGALTSESDFTPASIRPRASTIPATRSRTIGLTWPRFPILKRRSQTTGTRMRPR